MDKRYYLPHSTTCFICGVQNPVGLKSRFYADKEGIIFLNITVDKKYAGFTDVVHGGIQTALLDEAMGWCGFTQTDSEQLFFTREIKVKFRRNVISGQPIFLENTLIDVKRGITFAQGNILDDMGKVLTTATGSFVPIPADKMHETANEMYYIDDGRLYHEKAMRICKPKSQPASFSI